MIKNIFKMMALFAIIFTLAYGAAEGSTVSRVALGGTSLALVPTTGNMQWLYTNFKTIFEEAFNKAQPTYEKVTLVVPSSALQEDYEWIGAFPMMREWIGERQVLALKEQGYIIKNKRWEVTVGVPRKRIELDNYGIYKPIMAGMGASARKHPDILIYNLLTGGFATKAYDGKKFFDTTHAFGANMSHGKLAAADGTINVANYEDALSLLGEIEDDQGEPLYTGEETFTLVVGPQLRGPAMRLLHSDFISVGGGSTQNNEWKDSADLVVTPRIKDASWYISVDFYGLRPFIFQQQQPPQFISKTNAQDSDYVFSNDEFLYGADSFDNAGYGLPQLCFGSDGTV